MNNIKTVSIVVPVYNVEHFVIRALNSILCQNGINIKEQIELIIINDGSTDNSAKKVNKFIKKYCHKFLNLIYLEQSNQGLGATRNNGIKVASGDYLMFLDSDDILLQKSVYHLLSNIVKTNADVCLGNVLRFSSLITKPSSLHKYVFDALVNTNTFNNADNYATFKTFSEFPELVYDTTAWNKIYDREFIVSNNLSFAQNTFYEDFVWSVNVYLNAKKIAITDNYVYKWRKRVFGGSITDLYKKSGDNSDIKKQRITQLQSAYNCIVKSGNKDLIDKFVTKAAQIDKFTNLADKA